MATNLHWFLYVETQDSVTHGKMYSFVYVVAHNTPLLVVHVVIGLPSRPSRSFLGSAWRACGQVKPLSHRARAHA